MIALSKRGIVVAGIVWLVLSFVFSGEASCVQAGAFCDRSDLLLAAIAGVCFLVPSWLAVSILSQIFPSLGHEKD